MKHISIVFAFLLVFSLMQQPVFAHASYRLNGIIDVQKNGSVTFNCEDGRIYNLDISDRAAKKHDGDLVQIEAYAQDGLNLDSLKIKKIRKYEKRILPSEVPYSDSRQFAKILDRKESSYIVKNIRWARNKLSKAEDEYIWQTAKIDFDAVEKAFFVLKPFPPEWLAAHCLMLFTFKDGGFIDKDNNRSKGLVLSIEAYLREDQKYSLAKGLRNKFGIIWSVATWEGYAEQTCNNKKNGKLLAHEIKLEKESVKALLKEALDQADKDRLGEFYHTTRNNCTNNLVLLLNKFAPKKIRPWSIPNIIYNVRATMPVMVPKRLEKLGVIGERLTEVNSENFFASPQELFYPNNSKKR